MTRAPGDASAELIVRAVPTPIQAGFPPHDQPALQQADRAGARGPIRLDSRRTMTG